MGFFYGVFLVGGISIMWHIYEAYFDLHLGRDLVTKKRPSLVFIMWLHLVGS